MIVHCRGGQGRTGTLAACVLVALGHSSDEAIRIVRRARGGAVEDHTGQEGYIRRFEEKLDDLELD